MELKQTVATNIKYFRKLKNLTQSALAEKAELSVGYICDLESGHKWGTPETLASISNALEILPYQLFLSPENLKKSNLQEVILIDLGKSLKNQIDNYINTVLSENK